MSGTGDRWPLRDRWLPDGLAGVTLALLAVPEVLGYARIAGMPVVTGLYTMLLPMVVFALLGSSRHLVVGADSATAAILAAGLLGLAAPGDPRYRQLAGTSRSCSPACCCWPGWSGWGSWPTSCPARCWSAS